MSLSAICNNCGAPKPDDRYRACPDCSRQWRQAARKPGGNAERLEALRDCQHVLAALIEHSRKPHVHASIQPLRASIIAAEARARIAITGAPK